MTTERDTTVLLKSITLTNLLSYGEVGTSISLRPLNVVIGPNGSGKSNLIEAVQLLHGAPDKLLEPIRDGGGVQEWLWKGAEKTPIAKINAVFANPKGSADLRYLLSFTEVGQRFELVDERIENAEPDAGHDKPYLYYAFQNGRPVLNVKGKTRGLQHEDIDRSASILAQRKDPEQYPELTYLGRAFDAIRLYREWSFGRYTRPRLPQKADLPNDYLAPDAGNLGLVLNQLEADPMVKKRLVESLQVLYDGIDGFHVKIEGGTVQVFFHEGRFSVPATRLSDGTLRYLCLLAILCHPKPPPLVCIEEPELGLHPDVLPTLAELLKEASERSQLIVTTHSDILVDALSNQCESVVVAERTDTGTTLNRLDPERLAAWLDRYRLGELWTSGQIGGTRW